MTDPIFNFGTNEGAMILRLDSDGRLQVNHLGPDVDGVWIREDGLPAVLSESLGNLLDGLEANGDDRAGLSSQEWERRIHEARQVLQGEGERAAKVVELLSWVGKMVRGDEDSDPDHVKTLYRELYDEE